MYSVDLADEAQEQLEALPAEALVSFAELRVGLETAPWSGGPAVPENPEGALRAYAFARFGIAVYVVLDAQRRVEVIDLYWAG